MLDTLSNVKTRLGITTTDWDTFLTNEIQLVSDAIEGYCGRSFAQRSWSQTFYNEEHHPSKQIVLYHYPVTSIASIIEDTNPPSSPTPAPVDPTIYRFHGPTGIINANRWQAKTFFYPFLYSTTIVYTAGYAAIPTPILCVLDSVIQERYNKRTSGVNLAFGSDVQSITIPGSIAIQFDFSLKNNLRTSTYGVILGVNANILDPWASERQVLGSGKLEYVV
jgi:hypothetical protein